MTVNKTYKQTQPDVMCLLMEVHKTNFDVFLRGGKKKKKNTYESNQASRSITDLQEIQRTKKKHHKDQQKSDCEKLYSLVSSINKFLGNHTERDEGGTNQFE